MRDLSQYSFLIRPLTEEEGGGFLITFPDFKDCISDGETIPEAIDNGMDALGETIAALEEFGHPVPQPSRGVTEGQFFKLPHNLQRPLMSRAKQEGLSMDALIVSILAGNLSQPAVHRAV